MHRNMHDLAIFWTSWQFLSFLA